jgi:hypothetical protein
MITCPTQPLCDKTMSEFFLSPWTSEIRKELMHRIIKKEICSNHFVELQRIMQKPDLVEAALKVFPQT